jgi:hypothetical protein
MSFCKIDIGGLAPLSDNVCGMPDWDLQYKWNDKYVAMRD